MQDHCPNSLSSLLLFQKLSGDRESKLLEIAQKSVVLVWLMKTHHYCKTDKQDPLFYSDSPNKLNRYSNNTIILKREMVNIH